MKNPLTFLIAVIVALILLTYMVCFTVRYDQVAVVTVFNKAAEPKVDANGELVRDAAGNPVDPGSVKYDAGLYMCWPWPISKVQHYSKRVQLFEDQKQQVQTADGHTVIVQMYMAWKIEDPYAFFRTVNTVNNATSQIKDNMSNILGIFSTYRFDQLVNIDPSKIKLAEIEERCAESLRKHLAGIKPSYGIKVERVGIRRLYLPEDISGKVFARMRTTRQRLAQEARTEGDATAESIRKDAESIQQQILAFAERRAQAIRDEGDSEAAKYYSTFAKDQDLAIFLRRIQSLKEMLPNNTTFILSADDIGLKELMSGESVVPYKSKAVAE